MAQQSRISDLGVQLGSVVRQALLNGATYREAITALENTTDLTRQSMEAARGRTPRHPATSIGE